MFQITAKYDTGVSLVIDTVVELYGPNWLEHKSEIHLMPGASKYQLEFGAYTGVYGRYASIDNIVVQPGKCHQPCEYANCFCVFSLSDFYLIIPVVLVLKYFRLDNVFYIDSCESFMPLTLSC